VGPKSEKPDVLKSCYERSLQLMDERGLSSIAFPCIATGAYGYDNEKAANIALKVVQDKLKQFEKVHRKTLCNNVLTIK
jgi:O-acetyl-ADP-ribose deacetylase (regulator of RNase III)